MSKEEPLRRVSRKVFQVFQFQQRVLSQCLAIVSTTGLSQKSVFKECAARASHKSVSEEFPLGGSQECLHRVRFECQNRVLHVSVPQECLGRASPIGVSQECLTIVHK